MNRGSTPSYSEARTIAEARTGSNKVSIRHNVFPSLLRDKLPDSCPTNQIDYFLTTLFVYLIKSSDELAQQIEIKLRDKQSVFYKELEAGIRAMVSQEQAQKDSTLFKSHAEMIENFDSQYESKFRTTHASIDEKFATMVKDFEGLMGQARSRWDNQWSEELSKMSSKWTDEWNIREKQWVEEEKERALKRAAQDDANSKHYKKLLEEHINRVDTMLDEQKEADLSILDVRLKELEDSRKELVHAQSNVDETVQRKYGESLERLKSTYAESLQAVEEASKKNELALKKALEREREIHEETNKKLQDEHSRQLAIVNDTIAEERKTIAYEQQQLEESLRIKYQTMVESLQDKVHREQEAQMRRALDLLEKSARAESERSRQTYEIQSAAEQAAAAKFKELVGDLRETWQKEETVRAKQLDQRLRVHYDTVIEHMQAQLDAALKLNDEADKQWMEDVEARNRQQVAMMQAYEEKCRRLYDTRLSEYIERTDEELASYEEKLLNAGKESVEKDIQHESELNQVRLESAEWRAEYVKEMDEKYKSTVSELEARYHTQMNVYLEQLESAQAELVVMNEQMQSAQNISDAEIRKKSGAEKAARNKRDDTRKLQLGRREAHTTLSKVWAGLQTPATDQVAMLENLLESAEPTDAMIAAYEKYNQQLSAQLPLIQLVTRREYLKFQIKALRRVAALCDSARNSLPTSKAYQSFESEMANLNLKSYEEMEQQFASHMDEFSIIEKRLTSAVTEYNSKYNARFNYKGEDYLESMAADEKAERALSDVEAKLHLMETSDSSTNR